MNPADQCAILVPIGDRICWPCEAALRVLEGRGYEVRRVPGFSAIDQARNQIATDALGEGYEELFWIDSDVGFDPDDVERLRNHNLPIVCGIYPQKGRRAFACHLLSDTKSIVFGDGGSLLEIRYAGAGFLLVNRSVYECIQRELKLPVCNRLFSTPTIPFFQPMVVGEGESAWYLAEDFAFSERARRCGFKIMADSAVRLSHFGSYPYSWEDAGSQPRRYSKYHFNIEPKDTGLADS